MDFNLSEEQTAIRENVTRICNNFDDSYWLACDREGTFPGMTLFYTKLDRSKITVHEIPKMARKVVDSNSIFIDGLEVPEEDRIGAEGEGFRVLLHGLNAERILVAAAALGFAEAVLDKAVKYARERIVFNRPIGQNQAIQHPLASIWMRLQAAELMTYKAAALYDEG